MAVQLQELVPVWRVVAVKAPDAPHRGGYGGLPRTEREDAAALQRGTPRAGGLRAPRPAPRGPRAALDAALRISETAMTARLIDGTALSKRIRAEVAERGGLDYVEIEIRQDLIEDETAQATWAMRLARLLPEAAAELEPA